DRIFAQREAGASGRPAGDGVLRAGDRPGHGDPQSPESTPRIGQGDACHGSVVLDPGRIMNRLLVVVCGALLAARLFAQPPSTGPFDLVIANGRVMDPESNTD